MLLSRSLFAALALALLTPLASSGTLTVGPAGSGAQFTEIQAAVDAALEDDVILVQPGTYAEIEVDKPLRILGDGTGLVRISGVWIHDIGAGEELVLSGAEVRLGAGASTYATIRLEDCAGTVVLADLVVPETFIIGLWADNCQRALLLDSRIRAFGAVGASRNSELWIAGCDLTAPAFTGSTFGLTAHGIELWDSHLHLWRSNIQGAGPASSIKFGTPGGAGIRATRSRVDLFGGPSTVVAGGMGGVSPLGFPPAPGGPGLDLLDDSHARIQADATVQGGLDGSGVVRAPDVQVDGTSSFTRDPKVFPTLASSAQQVQLGSTFALTLTGNPGGYQVLFFSFRTGPTTIYRGVDGFGLLDRASMRRLASEVLPASAVYALDVRVPTMPSLIGTTVFLQAAEQLGTSYAIGNPVLVTITG